MTDLRGLTPPDEMADGERKMHEYAMDLAHVATWLARTANLRPEGTLNVSTPRVLTLYVNTPQQVTDAMRWLSAELPDGEVIHREITAHCLIATRHFPRCDVVVLGSTPLLCEPTMGDVPGWVAPPGFNLDPMAAEMAAHRLAEEAQQFAGFAAR